MTPGLREFKGATLRVAVPESVPEDMRHGLRELLSVHASNPRKGQATALMHEVCAEADRSGFVLMLRPEPFGDGMTQDMLEAFYGRFGFTRIQAEPVVLMCRDPRRHVH